MSGSPFSVACIGECMVELSLSALSGSGCSINFGGDTLNTAVYLKRAAADQFSVSYITMVGQDQFSDELVAYVNSQAIQVDLIAKHSEKTLGLYAIRTDALGERSFTYWRDTFAAKDLFSDQCGFGFDALAKFDLLYFSGITLAILPEAVRTAFLDWLGQYRCSGGRVAFDANYRPALWSELSAARGCYSAVWNEVDIALTSFDDERELFGDKDIGETVSRLKAHGVLTGVVKDGESGPTLLVAEPPLPTFPPAATVVNTTAAGDHFNELNRLA